MTGVDLLARLDGVLQRGPERWLARCPAHDDRSPSLSIRDADDRLLIHCFAGCDPLNIVHALGLELSDLFLDAKPREADGHHKRPSRRRIPVGDILVAIDHEAFVVAVIGAEVLKRRSIDDQTWDRLSTAVQRIGSARDLYR